MKLVFTLLNAGLAILIWRRILLQKRDGNFIFQEKLHTYRFPLPMVLQWYVLFLLMLAVLSTQVVSLVKFQLEKTDYLNLNLIEGKFVNTTLMHDHVVDHDETADLLRMPPWLRGLSLASPFVGVFAALVVCGHVSLVVLAGHGYEANEGYTMFEAEAVDKQAVNINQRWRLTKRQDMVLLLTMMPLIYIIMSVRSTSRMWQIMTVEDTAKRASLDYALWTENLECASVFQYYVVMEFAHLCNSIIKTRATKGLQWVLKFAGFQGVYAWVMVGVMKACVGFVTAFLSIRPSWVHVFHMTWEQFEGKTSMLQGKISIVFSFLTLLCVYNMLVICKMKYIKDALGDANAKFLGVRLLLLAGQVQEKVIGFAVDHSDILPAVLNLSDERGKLLHSSLLSYECLLVALHNVYAWEIDNPLKKMMGKGDGPNSLRIKLVPEFPGETSYTCPFCNTCSDMKSLPMVNVRCPACEMESRINVT